MKAQPILATLLSFLSLVGGTGCGQTKKIESPAADQAQSESAPGGQKKRQAAPAAKASGGSPGKARAKNHKQIAKSGSELPLASDPLQMLTPHGRQQLRSSLEKKGYLKGEEDSVPQALRKFQADHNFPETGMPDDDTLLKLGLEPEDVVVTVTPKD